MPKPDEQELIKRAQNGDQEAFIKLIHPYYDRVYATAMRLLGNRDDAVEVTQEAILRTFWKIQTFHGHAHFYTWLYRIALNLCYRRLSDTHAKIERRGISLDKVTPDEQGVPLGFQVGDKKPRQDEELIHSEEIRLMRRALALLEKNDFKILVLREFEELSYEAIAEKLRLPLGTVMSRLHRAREALAKRLRKMGLS
jgi:RNA polymerase sigma-70 factor (ECF subfamily)